MDRAEVKRKMVAMRAKQHRLNELRDPFQERNRAMYRDLPNNEVKYFRVFYKKEPDFTAPKTFFLFDYCRVLTVEAPDLEAVFTDMQGHNWSPCGEARELITELGLHHTSMSVGDLVCEDAYGEEEKWYVVDYAGFKKVERE